MRTKRVLPMPFLVLMLAGVAALFIVLSDHGTGAAMARDNSPRLQTIEQERAAEIYFRVLSWLSELSTRPVKPAIMHPQPGSSPHGVKSPRQRLGRVEFCRFALNPKDVLSKPCAHHSD